MNDPEAKRLADPADLPHMRFHHVGYAVSDIEAYLRDYLVPLFAPVSISEPVSDPIQQVRVCFAELRGGMLLELVEGIGNNNPVRSIVGSRRGGIYHLCYEVDDLEATIALFRANRYLPLAMPVPAAAFGGRRILFMISPQRDLIEFVESRRT
jgi:methylmalonyl-CoA/ethylmalonyl-CoA epimerase